MNSTAKTKILSREAQVLKMSPLPRLKGNAAYVYTYLCHEEVTGKRATKREVNAILSKLNFYQVARVIALLNSACNDILHKDYTNAPRYQAHLEISFFDLEWRKKICGSRWGTHPGDNIIFHRQQLLFLLDLAMENCSFEEELIWSNEARHLFGIASLMTNDLLSDKKPLSEGENEGRKRVFFDEEQKWQIHATVLPTLDFDWDKVARNHFGRAWKLWVELPQSAELIERAGKDWIDWAAAFQEKHGIALTEYMAIAQALSLYVFSADPSSTKSEENLVFDPHHILSQTKVARSTIEAALRLLCRHVDNLEDDSLGPQYRRGWDMTRLRQFPLIRFENDIVIAFDAIFLLKAATESVYYLLNDVAGKKFGNMFGHVYDSYIESVWRRIASAEEQHELPRLHANPMFSAKGNTDKRQPKKNVNDEVCDALVDIGKRIVIVEVKASLLSLHAKYSGNGGTLKNDVDGKFGLKTGAAQLAKKTRRLIEGERPFVNGLNFNALERIFPILVSFDTAPSTSLLCVYLNEVFQQELGSLPKSKLRVGKLMVLSSYEMEALEAVCVHVPLDKVLMKFQKECPPDISFRVFLQGNYFEYFQNETQVSAADAFLSSSDGMAQVLFGHLTLDDVKAARDALG